MHVCKRGFSEIFSKIPKANDAYKKGGENGREKVEKTWNCTGIIGHFGGRRHEFTHPFV